MPAPKLLSRDAFREGVFARDRNVCVFCKKGGTLDAHHVLERRLWPDGGYYLENGASVCEEHHLACERTTLSCEEVRAAAGIQTVWLPPHLYGDERYDKWGNPLLPDGRRLRGELFFDESVQKALAEGGVLDLFSDRVKYPRTYHLPWSPGFTEDDRVLPTLDGFEAEEVVVTLKLDGENTNLYRDGLHARSLDYRSRIDRDRIRALHASVAHDIPEGWRVCGENVWAEHSIRYSGLTHFLYVFSVWDRNTCLSWDETCEWAALLGFPTVPVLYRGPMDASVVKKLWTPTLGQDECEGYVVRVVRAFRSVEFRRVVGKYVREGHVRTHGNWRPNPNPIQFTSSSE